MLIDQAVIVGIAAPPTAEHMSAAISDTALPALTTLTVN